MSWNSMDWVTSTIALWVIAIKNVIERYFKQSKQAIIAAIGLWVLCLLSACDSSSKQSSKHLPTSAITYPAVQAPPQVVDNRAFFFDLSPWQQAKINWRQFEGAEVSVLADAQPAFMALRPHLPIFEQLTGIRVGYQNVEQDRMRKMRKIDLESKSGIYDIVPIGVTFLSEAYHNQWLQPLEPYLSNPRLTDEKWYDIADISLNSLKLCRKAGTLLSLPFDYSAPIFFYRTDIFNKYGVSPPDTYEDVVALKKTLQERMEKDGIKDIYAFATRTRVGAGLNTWTVIPTIRAYGGQMFDEQWQVKFNSPQAEQALTVYRDMVTGYGTPPDSKMLHFYEIRELFKRGQLASTILASHIFNEMNTPEKSSIWNKWDAVPMPRGPVSRETSPWAWAFAINARSRNKEAAWLFIQWASSKETARLLTRGGGSPRLSVLESDTFKNMNPDGLIKAVKWMVENGTNSTMQTGLAEFPRVGLTASKAFSEIFHGADIKVTLDKAAAKAEAYMVNGPTRKAQGY